MFCWYFRLAISQAADSGKPLSSMTQNHLNRCPHCRQFYHLCQSLGDDLARQAAALSRDIPATLTDRILRNVAGNKIQSSSMGIRFRPLAVAACVALVSLACVFFLVKGHHNNRRDEINETAAILRSFVALEQSPRLAALVEEPLVGELQNIIDDTESAARFLWTCAAADVTHTQEKSVN